MKKNIIVIIVVFLTSILQVRPIEPQLTINTSIVSKDTIPKELFGGFIELVEHYVNGPRGHWSQELLNRGFDINDSKWSGVAQFWQKRWFKFPYDYIQHDTLKFNRFGRFSQKIIKESDTGEIGVSQQVYLNDSIGHSFYIYFLGNIGIDSLVLSLYDSIRKEIVYSKALGCPNEKWQKKEILIPPIKNSHKVDLIISYKNKGIVYLDESSLMPENNINGVRKEFYDFYQFWKPGLLRYPGGCFADSPQNKLQNCIGSMDQRKSPEYIHEQRMDFGLDEFLNLCKSINAEPHITINFQNGTSTEAAEYVEYCNGSPLSYWGAKRVSNGNHEPYQIKFWEVGNEQWDDEIGYATRYLTFYDTMKSIDRNIKIIIDGNHWRYQENFDNLFSIVGNKCDIFGYHPAFPGNAKVYVHPDTSFLSVIAASYLYENYFLQHYQDEFIKWGLFPNVKQGFSEWWTDYGTLANWMLDTAWKNCSLESGLTNVSILNSLMKFPESVSMASRSMGLGMIKCHIDINSGKRIFYVTPSFYANALIRNHHGKHLINSNLECESYSLPVIKGFWVPDRTPYLDATVTATTDTLFINILSRYVNEYKDIEIVIDKDIIGSEAIAYELWSESYLDANTAETPNKVVPKQKSWTVSNSYTVPPHSFTILAIPCKGIINIDDSNSISSFEYKIYPNPVNEILYIDANSDLGNVNIYNLLGQKVMNFDISDKNARINLDFLPSGLYIADIKNSRSLFVKR